MDRRFSWTKLHALVMPRATPRHILFIAISCVSFWTLANIAFSQNFTLTSILSLPQPLRRIFSRPTTPSEWEARAEKVKQAYVHAYRGYQKFASPHDELLPLTNGQVDNLNGWGVSIFDSLDTMLLMGLNDEFKEALPLVQRSDFSVPEDKVVPFFETVIRYLGGLLSAYALSREPILLTRADDLATLLDPVFTSPTGLPYFGINTVTRQLSATGLDLGMLAEIASLQMEYTYLAKLTGKRVWWERADKVMQVISEADTSATGGMMPTKWNITSGQPMRKGAVLSVGAAADSAHEYLLKQYLLTGKTDKRNLEMYLRTTTEIITNLLYVSPNRQLLYVTDTSLNSNMPSHVFEHLSCFLPGLFTLGAYTLPLDDLPSLGINWNDLAKDLPREKESQFRKLAAFNLRQLHTWVAEGLAQTCYLSYADQPTGLGPDEIVMARKGWVGYKGSAPPELFVNALLRWKKGGARGAPPGTNEREKIVYDEVEMTWRGPKKGHERDYALRKPEYLLRPETLESIYLMWRTTGDVKWRERGWEIFEAIEKYTKTENGYAVMKWVHQLPAPKGDSMPSFFLAETLKYLYLMFINDDPIPLDEWVFNTEAHPFRMFKWSEEEKARFGITD